MRIELQSPNHYLRWMNGEQRRIGITGGIASGKSSIGKFLEQVKKITILDADEFSHEAIEADGDAHAAVLNRYGEKIINPNHPLTIDRRALAKIIFNNVNERIWLEKVIHPIIKIRLEEELKKNANSPIIALIVPLLFEANLNYLCSEIWVVNCTKLQQEERLINRDKLTIKEAQNRIKAQMPLSEKILLGDKVIDNSKGFECWRNQVEKLLD